MVFVTIDEMVTVESYKTNNGVFDYRRDGYSKRLQNYQWCLNNVVSSYRQYGYGKGLEN